MHLTVIAKEPRPGFAKTRLCPPCTADEAGAAAAAALADTLDQVDRLRSAMATPPTPVLLFDGDPTHWARPGWCVVEQRGDTLDQRLANAFDDLGPGVVVAMETPHAVARLGAAFDALHRGVDAIGLAVDGGYWAIALANADRRIFEGIPMSTSHTGLRQLTRLHSLGRSVHLLPAARDLDNYDDLLDAARRTDTTPRLRKVATMVATNVEQRLSCRPGE